MHAALKRMRALLRWQNSVDSAPVNEIDSARRRFLLLIQEMDRRLAVLDQEMASLLATDRDIEDVFGTLLASRDPGEVSRAQSEICRCLQDMAMARAGAWQDLVRDWRQLQDRASRDWTAPSAKERRGSRQTLCS